jgi:putative endonuclease
MATHNTLGKQGELIACTFLQKKGYQILEQNWRFDRAEIDIIAQVNDYVVFVEIKTRSSDYFGKPVFFVDDRKQSLLIKAAEAYIFQSEVNFEARFDIIGIISDGDVLHIDHIEDAFSSCG